DRQASERVAETASGRTVSGRALVEGRLDWGRALAAAREQLAWSGGRGREWGEGRGGEPGRARARQVDRAPLRRGRAAGPPARASSLPTPRSSARGTAEVATASAQARGAETAEAVRRGRRTAHRPCRHRASRRPRPPSPLRRRVREAHRPTARGP